MAESESERAELLSLWSTMKKHAALESGRTPDSLLAKHLRFSMEKEFVELLSNPRYLHHLAQRGLFDDERFVRYLSYLRYWSTPKYAKCLTHVHCLRFLELLQKDTFRKKLKEPGFVELVHQNQYYHWNHAKDIALHAKFHGDEAQDEKESDMSE